MPRLEACGHFNIREHMEAAHHFLRDLALVLCVAAVTTVVFQRLRQPVVFGYLLAGLIIGPYIPIPLVAGEETVQTLAELGVILLMFGLGLEFSLRTLMSVGATAGLIAVAQSSVMLSVGYAIGQAFGWTTLESIYAGAAVAISSTTIIVKAFAEQKVRGRFTEVVFGILIIEDLIAIFLLAILTTVSAGSGLTVSGFGVTALRLATFLAALIGIGVLVVPRLVRYVVRLDRPETTLVTAVGVCFASALLALEFGYSVALGAFIAGSLIAESGKEKIIEHIVAPVRDMFAAVFFVAVGMLIDPAVLRDHWLAIVVLTIVVVIGKVLIVTLSSFFVGFGVRTSVQTGMSVAQIGEFSFIIAGIGLATGATRSFLYPITIAVSALTTLSTPLLIRASADAANYVDRRLPRSLQTFVALYGSWLERLRGANRSHPPGQGARRLIRLLLLDAVLIVIIVLGAAFETDRLTGMLSVRIGSSAETARLIVYGAAALVLAPLVVGILATTRGIARNWAERALPRPAAGRMDPGAPPRRVLIVTLQVALIALVGVPLVAITQPFIPPFRGAFLLALVILVLGIGFWRGTANLYGHARAGAEVIAAALARQLGSAGAEPAASQAEAPLDWARAILPGLGEPEGLRLEAGDFAVDRTLSELSLRGRTGASVLAISRGGAGVVVPTGHEVLHAGDLLALVGPSAAIVAAAAVVRTGKEPEYIPPPARD